MIWPVRLVMVTQDGSRVGVIMRLMDSSVKPMMRLRMGPAAAMRHS